MLKYLVVLLNDNAVSYCHYSPKTEPGASISPDILKKAIFWAMKENLSVQFVHSRANVSTEVAKLIDSIDHIDIAPADADILVANGWDEATALKCVENRSLVVRTSFDNLLENEVTLKSLLVSANRVNIVVTNVENFSERDIEKYQSFLESLIPTIVDEYKQGHQVQFNLLTDRLMLNEMNNCNAGHESITLAPDGKFYICPAFYLGGEQSVGDIENGPDIKNSQLFKLDHAPICRVCDAFHCKRCVWLNKKLCREVNTPSHQQCVMAHVERSVSKKLLEDFRKIDASFLADCNIPKLEYLDPFDKVTK